MKPLGEVKRADNKYVRDIKRDVNIQTALAIVASIIGVAVCLYNLKLTIECDELRQEKQALEANCKDLFVEIENLKFGGNG